MSNLIIVEPTTVFRDWLRTALERPRLWAGGWPAGDNGDTGTVMHVISSAMDGPVTSWAYQIDHWANTAPLAGVMAGNTLTLLATTPSRTLLGANDAGSVLYGGLIEGTASMFPAQPDPADPDMYGHTLLCTITTIAIPTP